MSRALRRHHMERIKKRVVHHDRFNWGDPSDQKLVGIYARTRTPCSCWMCGNPRRHFGSVTRQEMVAGKKRDRPVDEADRSLRPPHADGMNAARGAARGIAISL